MHPVTRAILKAMGVFGGVRALSILCSLVRNKLIAVWIGPLGVGLVSLFNSVIDMICSTVRLNVDQSAVRDVAKNADNVAETATAVRRWSVVLGLIGSVIICAMSPLLSLWSFDTCDMWWTFCVLSLLSLLYAYSNGMQAILQGQKQFAAVARIGVVTAVLGIVVSVPIIYFLRENSIVWVILSYGLAMFVGVLLNRPKLPRVQQTYKQSWQIGGTFVRLGFMLTLASLMGQLFNYLFVLYVKNYSSTEDLGLYQAAYTVINSYVGVLFTGVWIEYFPRLSAMAHSSRRLSVSVTHQIATTVWILMPVVAVFVAADELIVRVLYDAAFMPMLPLMTIGMVSVLPRYVSWCMAYVILAKGDGKVYMLSETMSGLIGLVLNVVGYSWYGFAGLGVSFVVWYLAYIAIINVINRRRYGVCISRDVWRLVWLGLAFGIVVVAAKCVAGWWLPLLLGAGIAPVCVRRLTMKKKKADVLSR
jgi:PST family polysaccharide transporter